MTSRMGNHGFTTGARRLPQSWRDLDLRGYSVSDEDHVGGGASAAPTITHQPVVARTRRSRGRIASPGMLPKNFPPMTRATSPNRLGGAYGGKNQHGRAGALVTGSHNGAQNGARAGEKDLKPDLIPGSQSATAHQRRLWQTITKGDKNRNRSSNPCGLLPAVDHRRHPRQAKTVRDFLGQPAARMDGLRLDCRLRLVCLGQAKIGVCPLRPCAGPDRPGDVVRLQVTGLPVPSVKTRGRRRLRAVRLGSGLWWQAQPRQSSGSARPLPKGFARPPPLPWRGVSLP